MGIKDLVVLAGLLVVPLLSNLPCAWMDNKIVLLGLVLPNNNWLIVVTKIMPLLAHTMIWPVTVVGLTTLCTMSCKPVISITTMIILMSPDKPDKPEPASLIHLPPLVTSLPAVPPPKTPSPNSKVLSPKSVLSVSPSMLVELASNCTLVEFTLLLLVL